MNNNSYDSEFYINILTPQNESRFEFINNEKVVKLAGFLYENHEFLVYAATFLADCKNIKEFSESKDLEEYYLENCGTDLKDNEIKTNSRFIDLLFSFYSLCENQDAFAHYRGAILERVTLLFAYRRYIFTEDIYLPIKKEALFECCDLDVDCKVRLNLLNWTTSNPIDVAGWNQKISKGEGYECKINIGAMENTDNNILNELASKCCNSREIDFFNVGIVTFSNVKGVEFYLNYMVKDNLHKDINIYGRNNIQDISKVI